MEQLGTSIPGAAAGDESGYSVSLSADGTIVAIGAPYNDGIVVIQDTLEYFNMNGTSWEQLGRPYSWRSSI